MVDEFRKKEMEYGEAQAKEELGDALKETPPLKVKVQKGFDAKGMPVHSALTTLQEVAEEHLYLVYKNPLLHVVIEADLLGDQAVHQSDGKLPPVIHIECPIPSCRDAQPDKRSPLSITSGNKHFEIEDLDPKDWKIVTYPDNRPVLGTDGKPIVMTRRLTIKEVFRCSYCNRSFRITDNIMSDA